MVRMLGVFVLAAVLGTACGGASEEGTPRESAPPALAASAPPLQPPSGTTPDPFGAPPAVPDGPLAEPLAADLAAIFGGLRSGLDLEAVRRVGDSGDARVTWLLSDLLRFIQAGPEAEELLSAFERLTGLELSKEQRRRAWGVVTDHLIAWDLPAPPGYVDYKAQLFTIVEPGWAPFFEDPRAEIDWRWVSWGGVLIDGRALGDPRGCPRGCIPALDDPAVTDTAGGAWYPDDAIVFGLVLNGEARAYPKNIMEVHELVNDTLGGRRIGMPYCTLCGSAQAYLTDTFAGENLVLRTSGLLSRSNKVMYELRSKSAFDTFTGRALSGPLHDTNVVLEQITVVTSTWREWRAAHPETTIVAQDGGIGRTYEADPLRGRDDAGPIFPIGPVDPRLPAQEQIVGVIAPDGRPVAFSAAAARTAIQAGDVVELAGVRLRQDGSGLRAALESGEELVSHQAFWFAWSQFHPDTALWTPLSGSS